MQRLCFLGEHSHACLARPCCSLASLNVRYNCHIFFVGVSALPYLGTLGHDFLVCSWPFLTIFLIAFRAIPGAITRIFSPQDDILRQDSSMSSQTAWSRPSCLYLHLKGLLGLLKALPELGRLNLPAVGFSFDCYTGYVGRMSWQTPVLLFFDWQLFLVLSLLDLGGGEEITLKFSDGNSSRSVLHYFLTYLLVIYQSELCTSKKLVIVIIYILEWK